MKAKLSPARIAAVLNPAALTVINDGAVVYPVLTEDMTEWTAQNGPINATNYDDFCNAVPCVAEADAGTPGSGNMTELCALLTAAGSAAVRLPE